MENLTYKRNILTVINMGDNDSCEGCFFWHLPKNDLSKICKKLKESDVLPNCDVAKKQLIFILKTD